MKAELKAAKLSCEEYEPEGRALTGTIPSTNAQSFETGNRDGRPLENIAIDLPEVGSYDWYVRTVVDSIRSRFFTLKDFSTQGRAYFSEDFDFDPAAIAKPPTKFPDLKTWLPELADRFEAEFENSPPVLRRDGSRFG